MISRWLDTVYFPRKDFSENDKFSFYLNHNIYPINRNRISLLKIWYNVKICFEYFRAMMISSCLTNLDRYFGRDKRRKENPISSKVFRCE